MKIVGIFKIVAQNWLLCVELLMIISAATDKLMIRATRNSFEKKPNGMWDDYGVPNDTAQ